MKYAILQKKYRDRLYFIFSLKVTTLFTLYTTFWLILLFSILFINIGILKWEYVVAAILRPVACEC